MTNLPSDIYQELLSWLENDDQVSFVMVNRAICNELIKNVRVVWLRPTRHFERKFRSYLTSEKIQNLIVDPYHQLNLVLPVAFDLKVAGFDDISISCKSLTTTANQLTTSFIHCIKKVQNLKLMYNNFSRCHLTNSEVRLITDWINNSNLGLKELEIASYDITHLPVIPSLQSLTITNSDSISLSTLNLSAYCNLRCLKLRFRSIEDVSSLDGIHELHLLYCDGIRDISCLNHNYKIVMKECKGVADYSNSFRCSKIIDIRCFSNDDMRQPIKSIDLSKTLEAREIYFYGGKCTVPLFLPKSSSLRCVRAERLQGTFTLPSEHHIRELMIKNCKCIINQSLSSFDLIYSVKLVDLNISSLEGLGSGNRVVEVDSCPLITDFSPLRHCDKVTIRNCQGFQDVNQVRGVKELIFSPVDVNKLPKDMEGVTCLILEEIPDDLLSLILPSTLRKLVIPYLFQTVARTDLIKRLPRHVGGIEVSETNCISFLDLSFPDFIIEFKKGFHFLRKPVKVGW